MGDKKGSIGIFDSGLGGLEVLKHIVKKLPQYDFIYLGDNARAPYGSRSQEVIFNFTLQAILFLFKQNCPLIILACNTASAEALRKIQQEWLLKSFPNNRVLGVIIPAVQQAVKISKNNKVGVVATEGTIKSKAFERELKKSNPKIKIFSNSASLLVPIVEAGEHNSQIAKIALQKYLKPILAKKIDTLILGCTHYGILEKQIKKTVGKNVRVISEGKVVAEKLVDYLQKHPEIKKRLSKNSQQLFLTTDLTNKFQKLGSNFFGKKIKPQKITLE